MKQAWLYLTSLLRSGGKAPNSSSGKFLVNNAKGMTNPFLCCSNTKTPKKLR